MPLKNDLQSHYNAVLEDLHAERQEAIQQIAALQTKLRDLHASINTLSRRINPDAKEPHPSAPIRPALKYANMSVRWAILDLLHDSKPMATGEIADALIAGGVQTRAANFANNVSAVLSTTMKERHNEVQQLTDGSGKWELTERGKGAIEYIRTTPKFRRASAKSAY